MKLLEIKDIMQVSQKAYDLMNREDSTTAQQGTTAERQEDIMREKYVILPNDALLNPEIWVLGCILHDSKVIKEFYPPLETCDFLGENNKLIWNAVTDLLGRDDEVNFLSIERELNGKVSKDYLFSLMESVPGAINASYMAAMVKGLSDIRELKVALRKSLEDVEHPTTIPEVFIQNVIESLREIMLRWLNR